MTYSDRFIPSRAASSRLDFSILDRETAASETPKRTAEKEESNGAYNMLLRSELLGCPAAPVSPEKGAGAGGASSSGVHPGSPSKRWAVWEGAGVPKRLCRGWLPLAWPCTRADRVGCLLTLCPLSTHLTPPCCSPSRKLFRYIAGDADTPTAGLPTQSPYARGPIGGDDSAASTLASPTRMLRKIPRAPFKVGRPA